MSAGEIHKNDIGTLFVITVKDEAGAVVNISTATVTEIIFKLPGGTILTKTGAFATDGSDGVLHYTTIVGDLSTVGNWGMQAHVTMPAGEWHSDETSFRVWENIA